MTALTLLTLLTITWTTVLIVAAAFCTRCIIHRRQFAKAKARHLRIVR